MFRAWVVENGIESRDWNARFSHYLEVNFLKFPKASRPKAGRAVVPAAQAPSGPLPGEDSLTDNEQYLLRRMERGARDGDLGAEGTRDEIKRARAVWIAKHVTQGACS
jgi:hypothetical protein